MKNDNPTLESLTVTYNKLSEVHKQIEKWQCSNISKWLIPKHLPLSIKAGEFSSQSLTIGLNTLAIARIVSPVPALLNAITSNSTVTQYQALQKCFTKLKILAETSEQSKKGFIELGNVNDTEWSESSQNAMQNLIIRNNSALNNPSWLNTWIDYINLKNKISAQGLDNIIKNLELNKINTKELNDVVHLVVHHQLANEILADHQSLASFNGMEQMAIRQKYQEYDRKLLS